MSLFYKSEKRAAFVIATYGLIAFGALCLIMIGAVKYWFVVVPLLILLGYHFNSSANKMTQYHKENCTQKCECPLKKYNIK